MKETFGQKLAVVGQFALSSGLGCGAWLLYPETPNPYERLLFALLVGFGGLWLLMFVWVWVRYGRKAARSLTMDGG